MAKSLGLNEELVEAIALGHDLGHTPFGHLGEIVLHRIMSGEDTLEGILPAEDRGGFKHNYQSVRVVDVLEKRYEFDGLNLTAPVREGILKHTSLRPEQIHYPEWREEQLHTHLPWATTLEGQVVALADEIAQRTHDLEDGIRANFVDLEEVRQLEIIRLVEERAQLSRLLRQDPFVYLNALIKNLIDLLITDVLENTARNIQKFFQTRGRWQPFDEPVVTFSPDLDPLQADLDRFISEYIIHQRSIHWPDEMAEHLMRELFKAYLHNPLQMRSYPAQKFFGQHPERTSAPDERGSSPQDPSFVRLICDYIAGMTDNFALEEFRRLFPPTG